LSFKYLCKTTILYFKSTVSCTSHMRHDLFAGNYVEWPLMKVIITITFYCDNMCKSKCMVLENWSLCIVCGNVQRKSKSADIVETVPKSSSLPGAVLKAERVEVQICSPMYAKSMAKACSLLSSATEHVLYHCHYHMNVQVCPESDLLLSTGTSVCCSSASSLRWYEHDLWWFVNWLATQLTVFQVPGWPTTFIGQVQAWDWRRILGLHSLC